MPFYSYEAHKVDQKFKRYFGIGFRPFWLGWIAGFGNQIMIDLGKFDDYLTEKYHYEGAMNNFIQREFGTEAVNFIKKLL